MPAANPVDRIALGDELLDAIAARGGLRRYPAQTVLVHEGDDHDALFIVVAGRVKVFASNAAGREVILNTLGRGEYFGELAIDGRGRSASVMTLEPTTCAVVPGAGLRDFIAAHPEFALHVIHTLTKRLRDITTNVKGLALDDVYSRVVALLNRLARDDGPQRVIDERLTQQDIAAHVGASREMISRIFKDLTAGGYVQVERGRITVLKPLPAAW